MGLSRTVYEINAISVKNR